MGRANNLGIPITDTNAPFAITTADGGVDAVVQGTPTSVGNGLIFAPRTSYQVKAGDFTLNATNPAQIENLLIRPGATEARKKRKGTASGKSHQPEDIQPRIRQLPGLVWRSGMTDRIAAKLLELAKAGKIPPENLGIFSFASASVSIPDDTFAQWLDFLTNIGTFSAAATAINLASMSVLGGRSLTAAQLRKILFLPALFNQAEQRVDVMLGHHWLQLTRALIKLDSEGEQIVLRLLVENVGSSGALSGSFGPEGERFLDELVAKRPVEAWRMISEYIKPPMDIRGFVLTRWLRGEMGFGGRDPGPMRHVPREEIWSWISVDPETRAPYVANMAPKDFTVDAWSSSLIREVLCRFGDSDKVQSAIMSNFFTGGWTGPSSVHFATEKEILQQLKSTETNPNALRWLNEAIHLTERQVERSKIEEEARGC